MSTVAQVVDRVYREYLRPAGDYPLHAMLETTVDDTDTAIIYKAGYLQAEDEDLLVEGLLIEIGSELMAVTAVDTGTRTLTVERAREGTTAAAHTADVDNIYFAPEYPRRQVFDAVCDEVPRLWPDLWQVRTEYIPRVSGSEVTGDAKMVLMYRYRDRSGLWRDGPVQLLTDHPESSTGNLVQFSREGGEPGYLTYKASFVRPTAESDDLSAVAFGLAVEWEQILVVGAAAAVLAAADVDAATQEFLTEALETQGFPVHSGERMSLALRRWRQQLLEDASRRLLASYGARMERSGLVHGAF